MNINEVKLIDTALLFNNKKLNKGIKLINEGKRRINNILYFKKINIYNAFAIQLHLIFSTFVSK